jgi:hypothetical protein
MWKVMLEYVNEQGNSIVDTFASGLKERGIAYTIAKNLEDLYSNLHDDCKAKAWVEHYIL